MIQRCPECGRWCATDSKNFIERGLNGAFRQVEECGEFGEQYLGKFGKRIGQAFGIYSSVKRGFYEAIGDYKYQFKCECGNGWGTDNEEDDETAYYEHECYVEELVNDFFDLDVDIENEEVKEYLEELEDAHSNEYNTDYTRSMISDTVAAVYLLGAYRLDDDHKENLLKRALSEINESLSLFDDKNSHITKGLIFAESNQFSYYSALKELVYSKDIESHSYFSIESIKNKYYEMREEYEESFLEIPKEQRKYLVLVSDYVTVPDNFKVLRISNLPESIKFIGNNILENTMYVIHPLKDDTYIPYDEYSIELFREQLFEYRYIMECLGAKRFSMRDICINNAESSQSNRIKVGGGGEYKGYSAQGGYESSSNSEEYRKLHNELSQEIHCELSNKPYIPEDILWYHHHDEWIRNCNSRLQGRILSLNQRMSNRLSTGLTTSSAKKIEGEFNAMIVKLNANYESDTQFAIKEDAERVWEISVEFYPMSEYNKKNESVENVKSSSALSINEQKYLEEYKICLEDGNISAKERRLLETLRESLGISEEQAKILESRIVPIKSPKRKWFKFWENN